MVLRDGVLFEDCVFTRLQSSVFWDGSVRSHLEYCIFSISHVIHLNDSSHLYVFLHLFLH